MKLPLEIKCSTNKENPHDSWLTKICENIYLGKGKDLESSLPLLCFIIVSSGVVLIDRDENRRMDFENRTLRQYYDWQYFLKRQMNAERRSPI